MKKIILLFFSLSIFKSHSQDKADMVIFSFNRPLQLYALLESVEKYMIGLGQVNIIYRINHDDFIQSYEEVKKRFKQFNFFIQGNDPHQDFRLLVLKCAFETPNDYVLFGVDDLIVKDYINIFDCTNALKKTGAYGFFLRLGENITQCYMEGIKTPVPNHEKVSDDIFIFKFNDGKGDWRYPNSFDMTIYKKSDIINDLHNIPLRTPSCEGYWHQRADFNKFGLFFKESKNINIPLNLTTEEARENKNMKLYCPSILLRKFCEGYKIDINQFYKINNNSPHMEYVPNFIKRL
jgi:hypothetical protein